jgi:hypothetical protein
MDSTKLKEILELHLKWLNGRADGVRANLRRADLCRAYLRGANLCGANLHGANLRRADLHGANLREAYLSVAHLSEANLRGADLRGAHLSEANLRGADLTDAKLSPFSLCPEEGDFIAWKKVEGGVVLKLRIIGKRISTPIGRKCRTDKCEVLAAYDREGKEVRALFRSKYDRFFHYSVGEIIWTPLDEDFRVECTSGIHFFMTRQEAEEYQ